MAPYTDQAMETVMEEFEGLSIKKTAVHKFIKEECQLTFKNAQFHSVKRNEEETINKRREWIIKYTTITNMDYLKNCVFIDESGSASI